MMLVCDLLLPMIVSLVIFTQCSYIARVMISISRQQMDKRIGHDTPKLLVLSTLTLGTRLRYEIALVSAQIKGVVKTTQEDSELIIHTQVSLHSGPLFTSKRITLA